MHRAVLLATDKVIRKAHLVSLLDAEALPEFDVPRTGEELKRVKKEAREKSVEHIEKAFVLEALKRNAWNVTQTARYLGVPLSTLKFKIDRLDIRDIAKRIKGI